MDSDTGVCERIGVKLIWKGDIKTFLTYKSWFKHFKPTDIVPAQGITQYTTETTGNYCPSLSLSSPGYAKDKLTGRVLFFANSHGEIVPQLQIAEDKGLISFPTSISDFDLHIDVLEFLNSQEEREIFFNHGVTGFFQSWLVFGIKNGLWTKSKSYNYAPKGFGRFRLADNYVNQFIYTRSGHMPKTEVVSVDLDIFDRQIPPEEEKMLQAIIAKCQTAKLVMIYFSPRHNHNPNVFSHARKIYQACVEDNDEEFSIG